MRETTYWAKLCLVQVAGPDEAHCIDPLAPGIDLKPVSTNCWQTQRFSRCSMPAGRTWKSFSTARARCRHRSSIPRWRPWCAASAIRWVMKPWWRSWPGHNWTKSQRFTDWSLRLMTERQGCTLLADVTHLRKAYTHPLQEFGGSPGRRTGPTAGGIGHADRSAPPTAGPATLGARIKARTIRRAFWLCSRPSPPGARPPRRRWTCRASGSPRTTLSGVGREPCRRPLTISSGTVCAKPLASSKYVDGVLAAVAKGRRGCPTASVRLERDDSWDRSGGARGGRTAEVIAEEPAAKLITSRNASSPPARTSKPSPSPTPPTSPPCTAGGATCSAPYALKLKHGKLAVGLSADGNTRRGL